MLKFVLLLVAALAIEMVASIAAINFMFNTMTSESAYAALYVFGGPTTIAVMGFTVAMFQSWHPGLHS